MKHLAIPIILISLLFSSCAKLLNPSFQKVAIVTGNSESKVYHNDKFIEQGDTVYIDADKTRKSTNIRIDVDSCKSINHAIIPYKPSTYYYMSWFPFIITLAPFLDLDPKNCNFYYEYLFDEVPKKYPYWNSDKKRMYLKNIKISIPDSNRIYNIVTYGDYLDCMAGKDCEDYLETDKIDLAEIDSLFLKSTIYKWRVYELLKDTYFIDSTLSIFNNNSNTLFLSCDIKSRFTHLIRREFLTQAGGRPWFRQFSINADWIITDTYGDTLLIKNIDSESGERGFVSGSKLSTFQYCTQDAILDGYCDFTSSQEFNELIKYQPGIKDKYEPLVIRKPSITPVSIKECLRAGVTIKLGKGHGSGFPISLDGYIITSYHVVANEDEIKVSLSSGEEFDAELIRFNKFYDLALLKIDHRFDRAFTLQNKMNFDVGEDVIAIGTPKSLELGQSVTKGIVSGFREKKDIQIIQTDASLNSGNSGGALVNSNSQLVGIVQFKIFGFGTEGLSFAIPATLIIDGLNIKY
jgi:trypsin-like peptidase